MKKSNNQKQNKRHAFTLVELVIVIAVVAVLAAVLIPTFDNLVQKARETVDNLGDDHVASDPVSENKVDPTCVDEGSYEEVVYCFVCNEELSRTLKTIAPAGHNLELGAGVAQEPTCTEDGFEVGSTCTRPGCTYSEAGGVIAALGHDYTGAAATCTTAQVCTRTNNGVPCGAELAPALGHEITFVDAVLHTCTVNGNFPYYDCTRDGCTTLWSDNGITEIDPLSIIDEAPGHVFETEVTDGNKVVKLNATCTEDEVCYLACSVCGTSAQGLDEAKTFANIGTALGHSPAATYTCDVTGHWRICENGCGETLEFAGHTGTTVYVAATCTEDGYNCTQCSVCEYGLGGETLTKLGHNHVAGATIPATCTTDGYTVYTCNRNECSDTENRDIVAATNHVGTTSPVAGTAATCSATGLTDGVWCSACSTMISGQEVIPATGEHTYTTYTKDDSTVYVAVAATCTSNAQYFEKCSVCGVAGTEQFEAADTMSDHSYTAEVEAEQYKTTTLATCTKGDYYYRSCTGCGAATTDPENVFEDTDSILGHEPGAAATCTTAQTCTRCSTTLLAALGHTPGAEATCLTAQTCTVCSAELVAAKGHTVVADAAVAASCTATGLTEGSHCSVCSEVLVAQTTTTALGHTGGSATCKALAVCTRCSTGYGSYAAHNSNGSVAAKAATCTAAGYNAYTYCTWCNGNKVGGATIAALGHNASASWSHNEAQHWHPCTRCGTVMSVAYHNNTYVSGATAGCYTCGHTESASIGGTVSSLGYSDGVYWFSNASNYAYVVIVGSSQPTVGHWTGYPTYGGACLAAFNPSVTNGYGRVYTISGATQWISISTGSAYFITSDYNLAVRISKMYLQDLP